MSSSDRWVIVKHLCTINFVKFKLKCVSLCKASHRHIHIMHSELLLQRKVFELNDTFDSLQVQVIAGPLYLYSRWWRPLNLFILAVLNLLFGEQDIVGLLMVLNN